MHTNVPAAHKAKLRIRLQDESIISPGGFDVTNKAGEIKKESQWDIKRPWTIEGYGATSKAFSTTLLERIDVIKKWVNKSEELVGCDSKNPLLE